MRKLLYVAISVAFTAGCERQSGGAPVPELRLGYFANVAHAQAVLGVSDGSYAAAIAPARLSTRVFNAGPSLIEALLAGEIDIAYVGPGPVLHSYMKTRGEGIRVISGAAANGVLIVARKGSGIRGLEDLKGKRIATPQLGNTQDVSARWYMSILQNGDTSNVLAISNPEQAALMARGHIDAAWAPEPWGSRLMIEQGATLVAQEKTLWKRGEFTLTVVVTTPRFLAQHPELARRFLGAHSAMTKKLAADPQAHAKALDDALAALTGKRFSPGVIEASLRHVRFTADTLDDTLNTMARRASDLGILHERPQLDQLIAEMPHGK